MKIYHETFKSLKPTNKWIMFIAGMNEGIFRWLPYINKLNDEYNIVLIDNPGIGKSEFSEVNADDAAKVYHDIMLSKGIEVYDVIGHSWGGFVAQKMAVKYLNESSKVILVGTGFSSYSNSEFMRFVLEYSKHTKETSICESSKCMFAKNWPINNNDAYTEFLEQRTAVSGKISFAYLLGIFKQTSYQDLPKIKQNTFILHGIDDNVINVKNADILFNRIPRSKLLKLENIGHYPYLENEEVWINIISFLNGNSIERKKVIEDENLLDMDNNFIKAISNIKKYDNLIIELLTNPNNLTIDQLCQQYNNYIS